MGMRINTNTEALNTLRQLSTSSKMYATSMQRLSSGKRINSAADDAAGYAISQKLLGQSKGLDQASSNAQDGISMVQTASGGLQTIQDMLQRLRQLAVQSANDTNTASDRANLQAEADQIAQEITQIGNTTQFNTKNLLDGTFGSTATAGVLTGFNAALTTANVPTVNGGTLASGAYTFAVTAGAQAGTASTIGGTTGNGTVVAGGTFAGTVAIDDANNGLVTTSTSPVTVTATGLGSLATGGSAPTAANITAGALAAGTWTITNQTASGAWGAAGANTLDITSGGTTYHLKDSTTAGKFDTAASGSIPTGLVIDLSGATTAVNAATATFTVAKSAGVATASGQSLQVTGETGVTKTINLSVGETFAQVAAAITASGAGVTATVGTNGLKLTNTSATPSTAGTGTANLATNIKVMGSSNALMGLGLLQAGSGAASVVDSQAANGSGAVAATPATATLTGPTGTAVTLSNVNNVFTDAASGFKIDLSVATANLSSGNASINVSNNSATLQVGANYSASAPQTISVNIADVRTQALGLQGADATHALDISSSSVAAQQSLGKIDAAINQVSTQAASLGAMQNRLQNAINNLSIGSENMQAAYSSITNVDMAKESTNLATAQILQQSGIAMLAQANQSPQLVLKLLG